MTSFLETVVQFPFQCGWGSHWDVEATVTDNALSVWGLELVGWDVKASAEDQR